MEPVSPQSSPVATGKVIPSRESADRWSAATRYIERVIRTRQAPNRREMRNWESAGAWGKLAAGDTITASSDMTLGEGDVTLCSRSGATLTADGESVHVYNAGGEVTGGASGRILKLGWTDGDWSIDVVKCPT